MAEPDPYMGFKKQIGYTLVATAALYGILVTLLLVFWGNNITSNIVLWSFINTTISSMMGWFTAKAGTVIDNVWGTSQSSERKTEIMADTAKVAAETAAETKTKTVDPVGEAHDYKAQTAATVVKAEIAAENAVDNVEELKK